MTLELDPHTHAVTPSAALVEALPGAGRHRPQRFVAPPPGEPIDEAKLARKRGACHRSDPDEDEP